MATHKLQVKATTPPHVIAAGLACTWDPKKNDFGAVAAAPPTWPAGSFGTIGLPQDIYNTIWCQTGDGKFQAIYADTNPISGLNNRTYIVENNYVVCPLTLTNRKHALSKSRLTNNTVVLGG